MSKLTILFPLLLTLGCSTQQILTQSTTDLRRINPSIQVKVNGDADKELIASLTREINGQLVIAGFDIVTPSDRKIALNVNVSHFTPGNNALRLTVGYGAGRGSLLYTAAYVDIDGKVLASMDGQERFTGLEYGFNTSYGTTTTLGGEDTVRTVLVKEAGRHIVELAVQPQASQTVAQSGTGPVKQREYR